MQRRCRRRQWSCHRDAHGSGSETRTHETCSDWWHITTVTHRIKLGSNTGMQTYASSALIALWTWPFVDLRVNPRQAPSMHYTSIKFGVDSSSRFPFNVQTQTPDIVTETTNHPTGPPMYWLQLAWVNNIKVWKCDKSMHWKDYWLYLSTLSFVIWSNKYKKSYIKTVNKFNIYCYLLQSS